MFKKRWVNNPPPLFKVESDFLAIGVLFSNRRYIRKIILKMNYKGQLFLATVMVSESEAKLLGVSWEIEKVMS